MKKNKIVLTIITFISIVYMNMAYMFWEFFKNTLHIVDPFYKLDAIGWLLFIATFSYVVIKYVDYRPYKYVIMWGLFCVINNFCDEGFYQNIHLESAELYIFYFITIFLIVAYFRKNIFNYVYEKYKTIMFYVRRKNSTRLN